MTGGIVRRAMLTGYLAVFFVYLFGPIAVMAVTAFNTSAYPQAVPFEGFTLHWFAALADDDALMQGLANSFLIGGLVVLLAVPLGLAGALAMQQIHARARRLYYLVMVSPVLTTGVIIGISTVIFWRDLTGLTHTRFLYDGVLLTVLAQSSFIAAYCMLVFMARLQRFDATLAEAALDLGATRGQVFAHILLPFLRPAILSAAVLAFLSSFENYNTTTFSILADKTLTTVLAGRVRQGTSPALSALSVTIVAVTVLATAAYGALRRREAWRKSRAQRVAREAEQQELRSAAQAA